MRDLSGRIGHLFKERKRLHLKRNIITYGICLIIATVLWFLNTLNKEYATQITYPIRYTDLPKGKLLVSELPQEMTLEIRAHGFALLRYKIGTSFLPIVFNVNSYSNGILDKKDMLDYTLNTIDIKDRIAAQLNSDIKLLNITPETIHFQFSRFESKVVPVQPRVEYTLKKQYMLKNPISVTPDKLTISGPASVIDTIQTVYTLPIRLKDLSKDITKNVSFEDIHGVQIDDNNAKILIEVERFTESKKNVTLTVKNLPDSLQMRLFPSAIDVTFDVGLSRYDQVTDTSFRFSVDYKQITKNTTALNVTLEKYPPYIQNLSFSPEQVEFLIEKKSNKR
ncbi:CdaR family protein [Gabonibacter chumensis]|uniref:CdaR family protein n=1 Tax=Gabonibacter chumensis TaxID=2972474 RepID=UPI0025739371|nr:YbbR-like domain-containing protein [Gabonibacter chumensis]MCR9011730.1 CdaR family protein [Gabonibacter chumensis]